MCEDPAEIVKLRNKSFQPLIRKEKTFVGQ